MENALKLIVLPAHSRTTCDWPLVCRFQIDGWLVDTWESLEQLCGHRSASLDRYLEISCRHTSALTFCARVVDLIEYSEVVLIASGEL